MDTTERRFECVAEFNLVRHAEQFAARILEPGWWAVDVVRSGRKVTWMSDIPADVVADRSSYLMDLRETVGFYGSTGVRRARLNGVPCPISY